MINPQSQVIYVDRNNFKKNPHILENYVRIVQVDVLNT